MKCPGCGAEVEDGADLCLECGEPMGDSPAAKVTRQENVIRPPADTFKPPPPPPTQPASPSALNRPIASPRAPDAARPPVARKKWPAEEPEPKRCPGCGTKTLAARCPGCGTKLHDDE